MKANELMIGDWVKINYKDKNVKVIAIHDGLIDTTSVSPLMNDEYHPIPLTGKILKKNGFKIRSRYTWVHRDNYCSIKLNIAPKVEIEGEIFGEPPILLQVEGATFNLNIIVEYVHELQHALRLCGIEKEIII